MEKRKAIAIGRLKDSAAYETIKQRRNTLSENLTYQQLRMIEAFPKLTQKKLPVTRNVTK